MLKLLTVWITTNSVNFLKRWEYQTIPVSCNTCIRSRRKRTEQGTTDWFKIGKRVQQGYTLSACLFNLYAEYIGWYARLDESQAGIKVARKNNNLRYADDTTPMAESKEEPKSILINMKEESENGLKLNFQKTKIMASGTITSWQKDEEKEETVTNFIFLCSKITAAMKLKDSCSLGEKLLWNLGSTEKIRDITLPTKVHIVKAVWELDHKEG